MRWLCFGTAVLMSASVMQGAPPAVAPSAPIPATSESSIGASAMQQTTAPRKARRSDRRRAEISKKTRRPAARGSGDVTPPRIDRLTPAPGIWGVDSIGVPEIQIGFTETVTVPAGAISAWTVGAGAVTNFTTSYDGATDILTVSFASPVRDDRLTIVVDFAVMDLAGNELDGEIADPVSAVLPSGDGVRGGQAVFRINILQGDANRDGVVDAADGVVIRDALPSVVGDAGFDIRADLNVDGFVNAQDIAIFRLAEGRSLLATDGISPIVTAIQEPNSGLLGSFDIVEVVFNEIVLGSLISERTCFLVEGSGNIVIPAFGVQSGFGNSAIYTFIPPLPQCGTYTINISNALADSSGELLVIPATPPMVTGLIPPPAPMLNTHTTMTTGTSVTITGSAPGATLVEVSCPTGVFTVPLTNDAFTADITLAPDSGNAIFFTALSTCSGVRSPPVMTTVTHDTIPPEIFIDFPTGGAQITTAMTDVAGRVGDMLSGFMGLTVTVNGVPAIVDVGIGNNGTFFLQNAPLGPIDQPTVINAIATDELGNTVSKQITATRVDIPTGTSQMTILSGNAQTAPVMAALPAPVVVQMFDTDGVTPFVNKVVTFKVTRSDGRLSSAPGFTCIGDGSMMLQCHTDATGQAKALWTMGHDAGCGNNRVEVTSMSIAGTVAFCASATAATASQLNIGSGNNQRAEAGGPAPQPLRVWVSDGQNPVVGHSVLFTVTRGGGLVNGQATTSVTTDMTGHAEVGFTLGPDPGNNVVEATVVPDPMMLQPARFVAFGVLRDETTPTSFTGVVLNNASQPIGGATCTLTFGATALPPSISDVRGRFSFDNLLMAGPAHLFVDGSTATTVNGQPITPGAYPSLSFEPVIIPNAPNSLPTPVLLPRLETSNGVVFDNTQDIALTLPDMDGLEMLVRAGPDTTVTKADGTIVTAANPITLMLSQVHADDVPMPIPDGASPPFAWTLQPSGTTFDPPIEITYPNMSGLPAGSVAYFLSFNHATSRFEIVATGHVTDDGSRIVSDPGTGLSVAGWGCNCPPYSVTGDCDFDPCEGDDSGCCNDRCCQGDPCCESPDPCCDSGDPCCGNSDRCCNADNPCCDSPDPCCNPSDPCCGSSDRCCNPDSPCCGSDDPCCNTNDPCCGDPDPCCNSDNPCCAGAAAAAAPAPADEDESVASSISLVAADPCCGEGADDPCCNDPDPCCPCILAGLPCCGDDCLSPGQICCDNEPCGPGKMCCGGTDCCDPEHCCANDVCCADDCEKCLINGTLSGGMIDVDRDPVCVGDTITFTVSGVVDSGGIKRVFCTAKMEIPAVAPTYEWTVTKPDGTTVMGSGSVATILATKVGTYTAVFTAKAERECPPPDLTIGPETAEAIEPDLDLVGISDDDEENPGGFLCINDDDDNNDGTPDKDESTPTVGEDDLRMMTLSVSGAPEGKVTLSTSSNKIKAYKASDRSDPIALPACWATPSEAGCDPLSGMPLNVWVEGVVASASARDVTLTLKYENGPSTCTDIVKITVLRIAFESPFDTNGNGLIDDPENEFVYDDNNPGQLVIPVRVRIFPDTDLDVRFELEGRLRAHVGPIEDSHGAMNTVALSWNTPFPGNPTAGRAVFSPGTGGTWNAIATFSGLPLCNPGFGNKVASVEILRSDGSVLCERHTEYEVFFKPLPRNNPGPVPDDIPTTIDLDQVEVRLRSDRR